MNIFYQKDEPRFTAWLEHGSEASRSQFRHKYLDLARYAGQVFVETSFSHGPDSRYIRNLLPKYRDLDTVDIVVMSTGYFAKLDLPDLSSRSVL